MPSIELSFSFYVVGYHQISEDEITFLTEGDDCYDDKVVLEKLFHPNIKVLLVTEGANGCRYYTNVCAFFLINLIHN